jgi:hypothetical protein
MQCEIHEAALDLCQKLHIDIHQFHLIRNSANASPSTTPSATTGTH